MYNTSNIANACPVENTKTKAYYHTALLYSTWSMIYWSQELWLLIKATRPLKTAEQWLQLISYQDRSYDGDSQQLQYYVVAS